VPGRQAQTPAVHGSPRWPANGKRILDHFIQITIQASTPIVMIADPRLWLPCSARRPWPLEALTCAALRGVRNIAFYLIQINDMPKVRYRLLVHPR